MHDSASSYVSFASFIQNHFLSSRFAFQSFDSSRKCAQSPDISHCSRSDISRRLGAGADSLADPRPGGQLLAEAPVIPALRVPARELARRPGEPAAAERHPGRGATTAPRFPRDTDAVDAASGPQHTGDHPRAQLRHQWVKRLNFRDPCIVASDPLSRDRARCFLAFDCRRWRLPSRHHGEERRYEESSSFR